MKRKLFYCSLIFFIAILTNRLFAEEHIYTDQDLKSRDYEHQTLKTKKNKIISKGTYEFREQLTKEEILQRAEELRQAADQQREENLKQIEQQQQRLEYRKSLTDAYTQTQQKQNTEKAIAAGATVLGVILLLPLAIFLFWLIALIDILKNEFTDSNKLIWVLVVTFIPFIGPLLYYFMGDDHKKVPELV